MSVQHRVAAGRASDAGVTLIEVVVAIFVFALVAVGISGGTALVQRMSADDRSREVATNLAAQELDVVRNIGDPFQVHTTDPTTSVISGTTYTTTRSTSWISTAGADTSCRVSANLLYRRINVTVTWSGKLATTPAVRSDMILAPNGPISDPSMGTVAVYVKGVDGTPRAGVNVAITPTTDGASAALTTQPSPTDVDGCSYATNVTPGAYTVTVTKNGYVDRNQATASSAGIAVQAGTTTAHSFDYDAGSSFTVNYASNAGPTPLLPTNLSATFTGATTYVDAAARSTELLWPDPSGYSGIAGNLQDSSGKTTWCNSANPANWTAGNVGSTSLAAGVAPAAVAPGAGGSGTLNVPMGVVTIKTTTSANFYLTAVSTGSSGSSISGDPGCTAAPTYTFGQVLTKAGSTTVALPYGSYRFYISLSSNLFASQITGSTLLASLSSTNDAAKDDEISGSGVVTLDPRSKS